MVRIVQGRLNKRVFDRIREYKSLRGYERGNRKVKYNRQKLSWIENNTEKKLKGIKDLVENKEKRKGTAWSTEMMRR